MYIDRVPSSRYVIRYEPLDDVRAESTGPDVSAEMRWSTTIWPLTVCGDPSRPQPKSAFDA